MKTIISTILAILLLLFIAQGCGECDDQQTLNYYNTRLKQELSTQQSLANELKLVSPTDTQSITVITSKINNSLAAEAQIRAQIDDLKKHSKCL